MKKNKNKKSTFRIMAEAKIFGGAERVKLPTSRVDTRRLSIDEIKEAVSKEFEDAKKSEDVELEERPGGWGDDALVKEIEWIKKLDIKEFFMKGKKKKNDS